MDEERSRLVRLIEILTQLQAKVIVTAPELAKKNDVTIRTIYRDIRTLEKAGIPICTEEGRGYSIMDGYRLPPVMFTEDEANVLITVERLVRNDKDASLVSAYTGAMDKIKAILRKSAKERTEFLSNRIATGNSALPFETSSNLTTIQNALTNFKVLNITYHSEHKNKTTSRNIEPFAFYYNVNGRWSIIAFCKLRKDHRMFRLDRIMTIEQTEFTFAPHKITLQDYLDKKKKMYNASGTPS